MIDCDRLRQLLRHGVWLQIFICLLMLGILAMLAMAVIVGSIFFSLFWTFLGAMNTKNVISIRRNQRAMKRALAEFERLMRKRQSR